MSNPILALNHASILIKHVYFNYPYQWPIYQKYDWRVKNRPSGYGALHHKHLSYTMIAIILAYIMLYIGYATFKISTSVLESLYHRFNAWWVHLQSLKLILSILITKDDSWLWCFWRWRHQSDTNVSTSNPVSHQPTKHIG